MRSIIRAIYSPPVFDLIFALAGLVGFYSLFRLTSLPIAAIVPPDEPLTKGAIVAGLAVLASVLSTFTSRFDQKCAEDYMFQTLTKSAFIAIVASIIAAVLWYSFFVRGFGALPSFAMIMLNLSCWSVSYFIVRVRGTGA